MLIAKSRLEREKRKSISEIFGTEKEDSERKDLRPLPKKGQYKKLPLLKKLPPQTKPPRAPSIVVFKKKKRVCKQARENLVKSLQGRGRTRGERAHHLPGQQDPG